MRSKFITEISAFPLPKEIQKLYILQHNYPWISSEVSILFQEQDQTLTETDLVLPSGDALLQSGTSHGNLLTVTRYKPLGCHGDAYLPTLWPGLVVDKLWHVKCHMWVNRLWSMTMKNRPSGIDFQIPIVHHACTIGKKKLSTESV